MANLQNRLCRAVKSLKIAMKFIQKSSRIKHYFKIIAVSISPKRIYALILTL